MPSYNERLTANNQKIDNITTLANTLPDADEINEKIDAQDTIIENLKSALDEKAGKGGGEPNIFVQLEEPTTKKGIWLQKDAEPEYYIYDNEVYAGGEWSSDTYTTIPASVGGRNAVSIGTNIYIPAKVYNYFYKYDTLTDTYTKLADIPYSFSGRACTNVENFIYFFGTSTSGWGQTAYKYNINTNSFTKISDLPDSAGYSAAAAVGTDIYIFGATSFPTKAYKYNTLTNTYTYLANIPYSFKLRFSCSYRNRHLFIWWRVRKNICL